MCTGSIAIILGVLSVLGTVITLTGGSSRVDKTLIDWYLAILFSFGIKNEERGKRGSNLCVQVK
jgi:hypothetical protein